MTFRSRIGTIIDSTLFQNTILGVILFNAAILGMETSDPIMDSAGEVITLLDTICLSIFVVEIAAKLYARGVVGFFSRGWNIFDFVIVGISLVPASQGLSVLRALRILRLLRVVSVAPSLRRVVEGLGYEAHELDPGTLNATATDSAGRDLLMRLAVAGFAMMNVMLLSV